MGDEGNLDSWDISGLGEYLEKLCLDKGGAKLVFDALNDRSKDGLVAAIEARADRIYAQREQM